jgi:hypothetical protein
MLIAQDILLVFALLSSRRVQLFIFDFCDTRVSFSACVHQEKLLICLGRFLGRLKIASIWSEIRVLTDDTVILIASLAGLERLECGYLCIADAIVAIDINEASCLLLLDESASFGHFARIRTL